jgi:dTDP-4-dehydrorhamnose reductase
MIWIIGCNGMLGKELSGLFDARGIEYTGTDRECDITDRSALRGFAAGKKIEWIVNCSAYTAVDKAEDEEQLAFSINAEGAGNIAAVASELGANMLHISTDYVFSGKGTSPYMESEPVAPASAYGRTKLEGEKLVAGTCPRHIIIRTAWLYGAHGNNFVHTMLRLLAEKDSLTVVDDQRGTPTWSYDLSAAIAHIITSGSSRYGIYHFSNAGEISWFDFACAIRDMALEKGILSKNTPILPVTSDKYPTKAVRPSYSVLDKTKIQRELGVAVPDWRESLDKFLESKRS